MGYLCPEETENRFGEKLASLCQRDLLQIEFLGFIFNMWWGKRKKSKVYSKILIWETLDGYEPREVWEYRKRSKIGKGGK